ncbi:FAD binding domain-containing protein, partial [Escherichia coli]|uniref:FAD binding domain-containing protein n=29 Tax=cellular organisms TaxID=131567 RepID=UPI0039BEAB92
ADIEQALGLAGPESRYIAGGTNLLDLMKENVARPRRLIDITGLPLRDIRRTPTGGLLVGALVSNAELAWNPAVEADYP